MSSRLSTTTTLSAPPPQWEVSLHYQDQQGSGHCPIIAGAEAPSRLFAMRAGSATGEFGQVGTVQAGQTDYHRLRAEPRPQRSHTRAGPSRDRQAGLHGCHASIQSAIVGGR